eukprot:5484467-Pleurochrysis_carterae.AAC.1
MPTAAVAPVCAAKINVIITTVFTVAAGDLADTESANGASRLTPVSRSRSPSPPCQQPLSH